MVKEAIELPRLPDKKKINKDVPIGQLIRQLREKSRYSQAEVGRVVGVTRNHICEIESGGSYPSYELLTRILFFLGYEITVKKLPRKSLKKQIDKSIPASNGIDKTDKSKKSQSPRSRARRHEP